MSRRNRNQHVVPGADQALDQLKYEVAQELGMTNQDQAGETQYEAFLDRQKFEVASELGLLDDIQTKGWGEMTTRDCGRIGGAMGGKIGGNMVRKMIEIAEKNLSK